MKVLVVGGGGREHTLVWKLSTSPRVTEVYCAPGNGGTAALAQNIAIEAEEIVALADFAEQKAIDLTIVGPEAPLVAGIVDEFQQRGLSIFGPKSGAAAIEGSKVFAKNLMKKYDIPTAEYAVFTDSQAAKDYVLQAGVPLVVKAEGLAAGKGVVVATSTQEALAAVAEIMEDQVYGAAGHRVVIEEYLEGEEVTLLAFCDGRTIVPMVASQDHKRAYDGDQGPNTGGMGCYSPVPAFSPHLAAEVSETILQPTIEALAKEGCPFMGVLYTGLMLTAAGPKVLEYNARFGDPETQVVLPRLENDLVDVVEACLKGELHQIELRWKDDAAVCVVLAAGGYPGPYAKGLAIGGLGAAGSLDNVLVFHAGTKMINDGVVTAGGRVLGVTGLGTDLLEARDRAYQGVGQIHFPDMHFRHDIGHRALKK